ncbi:MAG: DUF6443 domain-containing protein [Bacteroidota bacterium]
MKIQLLDVSSFCSNPYSPVSIIHGRKGYPLRTGTNQLIKLTERTYDLNGQAFREKITHYEYNSPDHHQMTREYFTNSHGKLVSTEYRYAAEMNQTALLNKNMVGIPLETLQKVNGQLVGGVKQEYANFGGKQLMKRFYKKLRDGSYYLQAEIDSYLGEGSMRQFHRNGNVPTAYLWDANQQLPIAKAANAAWNEIAYASFEEVGKTEAENGRFTIEGLNGGYSTDAKTGMRSLSLAQGSGSSYRRLRYQVAQSGQYIVSFWYKGAVQLKKGSTSLQSLNANSWTYHESKITLSTGNLIRLQTNSGATAKIDEVRIFPADAQMISYGYDKARRMIYQADLNSRSTSYAYDSFGRLVSVKDQNGNIVQKHAYQLSQQVNTNPSSVRSDIVRIAGLTTEAQVDNLTSARDKHGKMTFLDGLGRTIQENALKATPGQSNWVTPHYYNALGQEARQYLPFPKSTNSSAYLLGASSLQAVFYNSHSDLSHLPQADRLSPFADTKYEAAPGMRVVEQGAAGEDWQIQNNGSGHTVKTTYRTNKNTLSIDRVRRWVWNPATDKFSGATYYPNATLSVIETTNENGNRSLEYTDMMGKIVLQRSQIDNSSTNSNAAKWANTYYLYDDFGNLRHVIQPEGSKQLGTNGWNLYGGNILEEFVFTYEYDNHHRASKKRVPGADWVYQVYDKLDRMIMSQDGQLRGSKKWRFTKFDALGRPVQTGLYFGGVTQLGSMQNQASNHSHVFETANNSAFGYSNLAFPVLPNANPDLFSISFYDDYDFNRNGSDQDANEVSIQEPVLGLGFVGNGFSALRKAWNRGMVTGVKVKVLDGGNQFLLTRTYYDQYGRELQTRSENHLGGQDRITFDYNFAGELKRSLHFHQTPGETMQVYKAFDYDHQGRLLKVWQDQRRGMFLGVWAPNPILLSSMKYDARGLLKEKNLHSENNGNSFLQSLDYLYNIRGWMLKLNEIQNCESSGIIMNRGVKSREPSGGGKPTIKIEPGNSSDARDLFAMELRYNRLTNALPTNVDPLYNGNIAGIIWQTKGGVTCDPQAYSFTYDAMDRLKSAQYAERDANQQWTQNVDHYSLESISYDQNGNILSLQRKGVNNYNAASGTFGFGMMDNLTYTYRGNRLIRVEDQVIDNLPIEVEQFRDRTKVFKSYNFSTHEYQYDANGNVRTDFNKGISVIYNSFNKPSQVSYTDPNDSRFGKQIHYVYTGDGTKIRQEVRKSNGQVEKRTDYVGGFQYETQVNTNASLGSRELMFFAHDEGRVRVSGNSLQLEYYIKDHLGNTRLTFGDPDGNGIADPLQEDHYYPFGMKHSAAGSVQASPANQYRYNGKEYQDELSLGWYDYGFRWYSADIARFVSVDPLAEDFYFLTTFQYASNSPIYMIDLDGLEGIPANEVKSEDITSVAETTTESMKEKYGNTQAVCNFGVRTAVETITGSKSLFPESSGGQVKGNGQANTIGTSLANGEVQDFKEIDEVDYEAMQDQVNEGSVIIGVFNSANDGSGGHIVMMVPGELEASSTYNASVPQVMENGSGNRHSKTKLSTNVGPNTASQMRWYIYTQSSEESQDESTESSMQDCFIWQGCEGN